MAAYITAAVQCFYSQGFGCIVFMLFLLHYYIQLGRQHLQQALLHYSKVSPLTRYSGGHSEESKGSNKGGIGRGSTSKAARSAHSGGYRSICTNHCSLAFFSPMPDPSLKKTDELRLQAATNHSPIPDSGIELEGYMAQHYDRTRDSSKSRGGGLCVYINSYWFTITAPQTWSM